MLTSVLPSFFLPSSPHFAAAYDMLTFLRQWFNKFPEFRSRDLFLTGESYAGTSGEAEPTLR